MDCTPLYYNGFRGSCSSDAADHDDFAPGDAAELDEKVGANVLRLCHFRR